MQLSFPCPEPSAMTTAAVHSFYDLRAFARTATGGDAPATGDAAFTAAARPLPLPEGPVAVAAVRLQGAGTMSAQGVDVFLIALSGGVVLQTPGDAQGAVDLGAGTSAVVPAGVAFDWRADADTSLIVLRCAGGPPGAAAIVRIDESAPLSPSGPPLAELLVGPTPQCRNFTDYRSTTGEFSCGTWDSTPYHRRPMDYRHYELMHLLEGAVTFVDGAGRSGTFTQGDVFIVERGARCSWESRVHVKKVYAIHRPT